MRWIASLFRIGLISVIVCLLSVATTWYTVSYYVDDLLSQFHITTPKQKQELSLLITSLVKQAGLVNSKGSAGSLQGGKTDTGADEGTSQPPLANGQTGAAKEPTADNSSVAGSRPTAGSPAADPGEDAVSVWSQTNANGSSIDRSGAQGAGSKMVISAQEFYSEKEKLSDDDKMKVFTILVENLPPDQLQQISQLVEDGITETELQKIDGILRQYVSNADYETLMNILDKI
ncbi:MAG: hypothetical protein K0R75_372 [Paenibacillaceae bacterium]|jgi:hypothetical protein|nr:hypothetical protein [Paenibacillaceae bacterium]